MIGLTSLKLHRLLLAASILVPALVFLAAAVWDRSEVQREGEDMVRRMTTVLDEHATKVFDTVDLALGRVDDRISHMTWEEISRPGTSAFLHDLKKPLPQAVSIWISDARGYVVAGSQEWDRNINVAEREWFAAQKDKDVGTFISTTFTGRVTGIPSFSVSRRRTTTDGSFDGIVHISLSPEYFEQFFAEVGPPIDHVASLVRRDGIILARYPFRPKEIKELKGTPIRRMLEEHPDVASGWVVSAIDDKEYYFSFHQVGSHPIHVGYGISRKDMFAPWLSHVMIYGVVAGLSAFTLFMVSWLALRKARAEQDALRKLREESEQRLAFEKRLRQSQKMESLGQLTGGIAHDFNNLLAVVSGNVELARKHCPDERVRRLLDGALRGAERGSSLTQRLLAFSRQQDLSPRSVSVSDLVGGMLDMMTRSLGPGIRIVTHFPEGLPTVKVDPHQLELSLLNLVVNARDAMPAGGTITITARAETRDENSVTILEPGKYVCISITDTGGGMDEETLSMAMDPFFTTKEVGKGTGLGLSMVHGLAVQSGGNLKLKSMIGGGTTAEIWLPQGEAVPTSTAREHDDVIGDTLSVLFVDDDDLVLTTTAAMLEDLGHEVITAASGAEALEILRRGARINIVVTDYAMPGMTGLQLAERIRSLRPSMPILVASGHAEMTDQAGRSLPRLKKPFRQRDLGKAIQAVLDMHGLGDGDIFGRKRRSPRSSKD